MMTYNFHTHTARCRHASGTDREYVENAIKGGLKTLGFSDHSPYVFKDGYYSGFRMLPAELEEYVKSIQNLKEEYKKDIDIYIGFEAEYYPEFFEAFLNLIRPYPIDYMILGQHFRKNEMDCPMGSARRTQDESVLMEYVFQVIEAMKTGAFTYLAHPDMIHYRENREIEDKAWKLICEKAIRYDVPLEINLLGVRDHRHYPYGNFWKIAGEMKAPVVIGADAHEPEVVADKTSFETAMLMVRKYDLNYIGKPKLVNPFGRENK